MMTRVQAIRRVMEHAAPDDLVLTTTGMVSREACMIDDRPGNFYMLGSMGLLSSLGLGLSLLDLGRRVFILEGDGSALMSLGALALIASQRPRNLVHVILDNESYESTGGQPTISREVDLARVGESCGYRRTARIDGAAALDAALAASASDGPHLIVVKVAIAPVEGIPRVSRPPEEIRDRFKASVQRVSLWPRP
jgi:phosphonopyruvate decarboxylase